LYPDDATDCSSRKVGEKLPRRSRFSATLPLNNWNVSRNLLSGHALAFFFFFNSLLLCKMGAKRFLVGGSQIKAAFRLHKLPVPQSVVLFAINVADATTNIRTIAMLLTVIS
jgi:hypothetical protein